MLHRIRPHLLLPLPHSRRSDPRPGYPRSRRPRPSLVCVKSRRRMRLAASNGRRTGASRLRAFTFKKRRGRSALSSGSATATSAMARRRRSFRRRSRSACRIGSSSTSTRTGPTRTGTPTSRTSLSSCAGRWQTGKKILLNPTLDAEYKIANHGPNVFEGKLLLGEQLAPRLHWGANLVYERELRASRTTELLVILR